ncbi:filamentous hemagglutinin outer membrane protein [Calothrix sp. NIES-4071]|nr:filamentous hemagglutinin outer membrane protein [Calothrix sp. NIES-4071]BAZ56890.1 filamentous hemagglutinin outer membrane protein [Calothrix sp. NIES-4105]
MTCILVQHLHCIINTGMINNFIIKCFHLAFISCITVSSFTIKAVAQITPDTTLPTNSSVRFENNISTIEGGTTVGGNLFHSFRDFSVNTRSEAFFNNAVDIRNIITRVTGQSVSNIDGIIKANVGANLFLINPNGIIFGQNARLDIGGSFVGSTANAIGFGSNGNFSATNPEAPSPLLTINPSALLFNQIQTGKIQNSSVAPDGRNPSDTFTARGLRVEDGYSLLLVGGDVSISDGGLYAFGGRVELGGLAGIGTVGLNGDDGNFSLTWTDGIQRSDVSLSNNARVNVRAGNGGSVAVNARNLEMTGDSQILAGIESRLGSDNSKAGNIDINATGTISIQKSDIFNDVRANASGQGGNVNIRANSLKLTEGGQISASTFSAGQGGNLTVNASYEVELSGVNTTNGNPSGLFTRQRTSDATGNAGSSTITTPWLKILGGATVSASTNGAGRGGNLNIDASTIEVIGTSSNGSGSRIAAQADSTALGEAGNLTIKTDQLIARDGGQISASTFGAGQGGDLKIDATSKVELNGRNTFDSSFPSGLFVTQETEDATGNAGTLTINTPVLQVLNGATVSASTDGAGRGGNLNIDASTIEVIGTSSNGSGSRIAAQADLTALGEAGNLTIKTDQLIARDGGQISASTFGIGQGGDLKIDATSKVELNGRNTVDSSFPSGLFVTQETEDATGNAGTLTINTPLLQVLNGATVSGSTNGIGRGGNLNIDASTIEVIGASSNGSGSRIAAQANSTALGEAGNLAIKTGQLIVRDGGQISASTFGIGQGGDLKIDATSKVELNGRNTVDSSFPSGLFVTQETEDATGNAGTLTINTPLLQVLNGATVSASTDGAGRGGDLKINTGKIEVIGASSNESGSSITAEANQTATGAAGNLTIKTDDLIARDGGQIRASTLGSGQGGDLKIDATSKVELNGRNTVDSSFPSGLFVKQETEDATGNAGTLTINTPLLQVLGGAIVSASTDGAGRGGNLNIDASTIQVIGASSDGSSSQIVTDTDLTATGAAGNLTIKTDQLIAQDGGQISASTDGAGQGGDLKIDATSKVELIGVNTVDSTPSGLFAQQGTEAATGNAGSLIINTPLLRVIDGANVSASTSGSGQGGNLTVNATSKVELNGRNTVDSSFPSGLFVTQETEDATGNAGTLTINTPLLQVLGGAIVSASTDGVGRGGNLNIDASTIQVIGASSDGYSSQIVTDTDLTATGAAGNLTIKTRELIAQDGGQISASTDGAGQGGDLKIDATSKVELIGVNTVDSTPSGLFVQQGTEAATGNAGNLIINTPLLRVIDGANVSASTSGAGEGGNLTVNATSKVELNGRNTVDSSFPSGLFVTQETEDATGNAGTLTINTPLLQVLGGATVSASTGGAGRGGDLNIDASTIKVIGASSDGSSSSITAQANSSALGEAGNLTIKTGELLVRDRAIIAVESLGTGTAGKLTIDARSINLDNKAILTANTRSNRAEANQATIDINSRDLILRRGSIITTDARGSEVIGGNININADILALLEASRIAADSANSSGGNINIKTQGLFRSLDSSITATGATRALSGNVNITTLVDPSQGLVELNLGIVDASRLINQDICAVSSQSSFTVTGRGGIASSPDNPAVSNFSWEDWRMLEVSKQQQTGLAVRNTSIVNNNSPVPNQVVEAQGWVIDFDGTVMLTATAPASLPQNNVLSQCQS